MKRQRREVLAGLATTLVAGAVAGRASAISAIAQPIELHWPMQLVQGGWLRGQASSLGGHDESLTLRLDDARVPLSSDGTFFVAFDRDAPPAALLSSRGRDGRFDTPLTIARRAWRIEHVDVGSRPEGMPDAQFLALRKAELARIAGARAKDTGAQGWRQDMIWPARGRLSGHFGAQRVYRGGVAGAFHTGADIAGGAGAPIMAPADGVVILAAEAPFTLEGHLLMLDHGMGLNSAMLHCSQLLVREGQAVRQGEPIARIGMTGRATGPHLHWGLKWREARLDPELFVNGAAAI
jgi:hypothetical protein